MTTISPAETERHIKALASHGAGPCCDAAYAAVEHMRALQQRVTELEAVVESEKNERYAAINEMANARRARQEAELCRDTDRMLGYFTGEDSQGQFQRLYLRCKELEKENKRVTDEREAAKRELEQKTRDYDTLRENHTELQREYRELADAVQWVAEDDYRTLGADYWTDGGDIKLFNGDPVAALKRLYARNRT